METKNCITELLKIEALPETEKQITENADVINAFLEKQDGFINAELIKGIESNTWYFIYHIENMEKVKVVSEKLRSTGLFAELMPLLVPGSMSVTFYQCLKTW
jgi:hypothetical protein